MNTTLPSRPTNVTSLCGSATPQPMTKFIEFLRDVFPAQVAMFFILCTASFIFYVRKDCNKNRRLRIFMSTIVIADTVCIQILVLIYFAVFNRNTRLGPNDKCILKPLSCFLTMYFQHKTFYTFCGNLAAAISTWSITMMLFDHLAGIKNPFGRQAQDRPVRTAYLTIIFVIFFSFLFTIYHIFAFNMLENQNCMVPMRNTLLMQIFSSATILYQYVVPTGFMFVYIYLISYHIHMSQKVFSNRNEVCNAATRSLSTDGLRVHRGRRFNESQRRVKIIPRMLVFVATNCLLTNMPSAYFIVKGYIINGGVLYTKSVKSNSVEMFFLSNFCLISGKIMFYVIVLFSHLPRFLKLLAHLTGFKSLSKNSQRLQYGSVQSDGERRKLSKTSTARSDASAGATTLEEQTKLIMRRTQSNITRKTTQNIAAREKRETHQPEIHSIHSFNIEKLDGTVENLNGTVEKLNGTVEKLNKTVEKVEEKKVDEKCASVDEGFFQNMEVEV